MKAKLTPSDDITVYYKTTGNLARVIADYQQFISATVKQPLHAFTAASPPSGPAVSCIVSDNAKVITVHLLSCYSFVLLEILFSLKASVD